MRNERYNANNVIIKEGDRVDCVYTLKKILNDVMMYSHSSSWQK